MRHLQPLHQFKNLHSELLQYYTKLSSKGHSIISHLSIIASTVCMQHTHYSHVIDEVIIFFIKHVRSETDGYFREIVRNSSNGFISNFRMLPIVMKMIW